MIYKNEAERVAAIRAEIAGLQAKAEARIQVLVRRQQMALELKKAKAQAAFDLQCADVRRRVLDTFAPKIAALEGLLKGK